MTKNSQIRIAARTRIKDNSIFGYAIEYRNWGRVIRKPYETKDLILPEWDDWKTLVSHCDTLDEAQALQNTMADHRPNAEFLIFDNPEPPKLQNKDLDWIEGKKCRSAPTWTAIITANTVKRPPGKEDHYKISQVGHDGDFFLAIISTQNNFPIKICREPGRYNFSTLKAAKKTALAHHKSKGVIK